MKFPARRLAGPKPDEATRGACRKRNPGHREHAATHHRKRDTSRWQRGIARPRREHVDEADAADDRATALEDLELQYRRSGVGDRRGRKGLDHLGQVLRHWRRRLGRYRSQHRAARALRDAKAIPGPAAITTGTCCARGCRGTRLRGRGCRHRHAEAQHAGNHHHGQGSDAASRSPTTRPERHGLSGPALPLPVPNLWGLVQDVCFIMIVSSGFRWNHPLGPSDPVVGPFLQRCELNKSLFPICFCLWRRPPRSQRARRRRRIRRRARRGVIASTSRSIKIYQFV